MLEVENLDQPPPGWSVLNVMRTEARKWDWVALMVDVDPDELKHYRCKFAWLYVHPDEYRPGDKWAREALVRIPGKHRNSRAAWEALQDMMETRH